MSAYRLPVSGEDVVLCDPNGHDEVLLAQPPAAGIAFQLEVLARLAPPEKADLRWEEMPIADLDPAFLAIRERLVGDRIVAEVSCPVCGGKGDLTFSVHGYLAAHAPEKLRNVTELRDGWYQCTGARFRMPTTGDWLAAAVGHRGEADTAAALEQCSIETESSTGRRRARRTLEKMAPLIAGPVVGTCPDCHTSIDAWFDPAAYVLAELAQRAIGVFEQAHLIADRYSWTESVILDLPNWRRTRYAALIAADAGTARVAAL